MKKSARALNLLLALALISSLGLPGLFAKESKEGSKENQEPPKKVIGVIPVQKTVPYPLYLSTEPGALESIKRLFRDKKLNLQKQVDYDPRYVPGTLEQMITERIFENGYLVYTPEQIAPQFGQLTLFKQEFPIEQLSQYFDAGAFLLITLTEWNADKFDRNGTVKVGFQAVLVDAQTKKVVWSNEATGMKLKTPSDDFLYSKYQRDVLNDLAKRILKGFPKNDWIIA